VASFNQVQAACSSETLVYILKATSRNNAKDHNAKKFFVISSVSPSQQKDSVLKEAFIFVTDLAHSVPLYNYFSAT
jgi:hypothetical protein